jgi:hypothetical protein
VAFLADDDDEGNLEARVEEGIEDGVERLRKAQNPDGSWPGGYNGRPGATALGLYALLASGVPPGDDAVLRAVENLSGAMEGVPRSGTIGTYDAACMLLALSAHDPAEHRGWMEELALMLIDWQTAGGDWAYPYGGPDLSNTQFAALGLRAAALAGVPIEDSVWRSLARGVLRYAAPDGSFTYGRTGRSGTASMTAAGVGTLSICDAMLSASGELPTKLANSIRTRHDRGLVWLGKKMPQLMHGSTGRTSYYTMYGIERIGAFDDLALIGGEDWYRLGADTICDDLTSPGFLKANRRQFDVVQNSFALLFLRRATKASVSTGAGAPPSPSIRAVSDPNADVRFVANGTGPTLFWVTGFGARVREAFEWPGAAGGGLRIARVSYLAAGRVLAEVEGDPSAPAGHERFSARYRFPEPGTYNVHARVVLMRPPHETADGRTLPSTPAVIQSPELVCTVDEMDEKWLASEEPARRNMLSLGRPRVDASSKVRGSKHSAERAIDGRERTSWLASPDDERPKLLIRFAKAVPADRVLFSNARSVPYQPGYYSRATQIEVRVNDGPAEVIAMSPDERLRGRLDLPPETRVRKLDLRLLWPVQGEVEPSVGLCEVELQRD